MFLVALARGAWESDLPPRADGPRGDVREARHETVFGTWRGQGSSGRGWLVPPRGEPWTNGHRLILDPGELPIGDGEELALLPGSPVVPWPRGPVPGPIRSEGRFLGVSSIAPDELVRLAPAPRNWDSRLLGPGRQWMGNVREQVGDLGDRLDEESRAPGLLRALWTGDRSGLDPDLLDLFTRTGTRHLLAISGLHVGLFGLLVLLPLGRGLQRTTGRSAFGIGVPLLGLVFFSALAGGASPVVRATIALGLGLAAPWMGKGPKGLGPRVDPLSLWGLALGLECLGDPTAVLDLSTQLSYLATLGLGLGCAPLSKRLDSLLLPAPAWSTAGRLRRWVAPLQRTVTTAVAASVAAVLGTLPVTWTTFGEVSPWGILLTPLLVLPLGLLLAFGGLVALAPFAQDAMIPIGHALIAALVGLTEQVDRWPGTPWPLPLRPVSGLWILVVLLFARLRVHLSRGLACAHQAAAAVFLLPWQPAAGHLEIHALDVGHGTAVVARAPGLDCVVFDAGSRDRPYLFREALAPLLRSWEIHRPYVVLSHDHRDHRAGLEALLERFPPRLWCGALSRRGARRLPADCARIDLKQGRSSLHTRAGAPTLVLARGLATPGNEGSRSLEIGWAGQKLLLCGDAEAAGLRAMLAPGPWRSPLRLLLFPHHGSETPWLSQLLDSTCPQELWISADGEPALARELDRRRVPWRATGREGPLALSLAPQP